MDKLHGTEMSQDDHFAKLRELKKATQQDTAALKGTLQRVGTNWPNISSEEQAKIKAEFPEVVNYIKE